MFFNERIKKLSVAEIEETIAKALSEKIGEKITCNLSQLDLSKVGYATIQISVHEPSFYEDLKG
jgi:hypothetical protein